ncbi:MAG: tryptophan synthase subunit alpha, partial [Xanthomonadales bacterium]|nr:tryptophan synthase subunit alpha [Xanthomonadales bacterium]
GVPFSDPMADGPTIQHADERALARGVGLDDIFAWVSEFRERDERTPVVLMGYLNPIEIRGYARFASEAVAAGIDGVLLVDCPVEEHASAALLREAGLRQIMLAAPTTGANRLPAVCGAAQGFLYYVSFTGITGAKQLDVGDIAARVAVIREHASVPVAVGFGIRDAASAVAIAAFADAVVIGSALVEQLAVSRDGQQAAACAQAFLTPIRAALDERKRAEDITP